MDETISISLPLDDDGFLRRACAECLREFKWRPSDDESAESITYHCPYCGLDGGTDGWLTAEHSTYVQDQALLVLESEFDELRDQVRQVNRSSGGLLRLDLTFPEPRVAAPLFEPNDMRKVEFRCHPAEPVKVLESWTESVNCLVCGAESGG